MLSVYLFGPPRLEARQGRVSEFTSRRSKSLFCLLALHAGHSLSRAQIAATLWANRDDGKVGNCLSTELWRLRKTLRRPGIPDGLIRTNDNGIGFCTDCRFWSDIQEFERLCQNLPHDPGRDSDALLTLCHGDFAEGLDDEWCWMERERLRGKLADLLLNLLNIDEQQEAWGEVIRHGYRLLAFDPLQERVHRAMIRAHVALGNRTAALRQFRNLASRLHTELNSVPTPETLHLIHAIGDPSGIFHGQAVREQKPADANDDNSSSECLIERALQHLATAENLLREARGKTPNP